MKAGDLVWLAPDMERSHMTNIQVIRKLQPAQWHAIRDRRLIGFLVEELGPGSQIRVLWGDVIITMLREEVQVAA